MLRTTRTLIAAAAMVGVIATAGCSQPATPVSGPTSAQPSAAADTPSPVETPSPTPSPSETGYPEATVEVTGSPKTSGKAEKDAVEVAKKFLVAFNTSFSTGEVDSDIFIYAPTLAEPIRDALKKDKKKGVSYAGPARYTQKTVSADDKAARVGVCGDLTEQLTITDDKAVPTEEKPVSQQVQMTYGMTTMYRGYLVEGLAEADSDYC